MAATVAHRVADGEVPGMAVAAFAERLYVLKCGSGLRYMFAAYPARHHAVQLAGDRFVNFVTRVRKFAHGR